MNIHHFIAIVCLFGFLIAINQLIWSSPSNDPSWATEEMIKEVNESSKKEENKITIILLIAMVVAILISL